MAEVLPFGLGANPSPPDPLGRDFILHLDTAATLPRRFVSTLLAPPDNQGNTGRCVAFALTGMKKWEERREPAHTFINLDQQWLYRRACATDGNPTPYSLERGTTLRAGLTILLKEGQPARGEKAVGQNKIAAYYAVPQTKDAIKRAIMQHGPVVIASQFPWSWFHPVAGVMPKPSGGIAGGHAQMAYGWDEDRGGGSLIVRNSWGGDWGIHGNSYIPWRYLLPLLHDAWRATDVIGD